MSTICGHERSELLCVLHWSIRDDERKRTKERCECGGACCTIYNNLIDPAKLAEIMAEELRRRGLAINNDTTKEDQVHAFVWHEAFTRTGIGVNVCDPNYRSWRPIEPKRIFLDTPQARAALLRILLLPEGTPITEVLDALKI